MEVVCGNCSHRFDVQPRAISQILHCPECNECVTVPAVQSAQTDLCSVDKSKPVWKWRDILIGILLVVLLYGIIREYYYANFPFPLWVGVFGMFAMSVFPAVFAVWIYRKRTHSYLLSPLSLKKFIIESLWAFLYVALFWLFFMVLVWVLKWVWGFEDTTPWDTHFDYFRSNYVVYIAILVFVFTLIPLCEELYFRGFLYNALKGHMHWLASIVLQALFFAVLHEYNWYGSIYVFLMGLLLVVIYEHRKNLLTSILAHAQMNFVFSALLIIGFAMNWHVPAQNWEEAQIRPEWLTAEPPAYVEKMASGEAQRQYAIEMWGTQGDRLWKKEMNAFNAVLVWFPEEHQACSKALLGMVIVYGHHLQDHRRAIISADELLQHCANDRQTRASAWMYKAYSYYYLAEYACARHAAEVVLVDYPDCEYEFNRVEYLLEVLLPDADPMLEEASEDPEKATETF